MSQLITAAKAVIKDAAFNNPVKSTGKERPTVKIKSTLVEELHAAAIGEHDLQAYTTELEGGIKSYAQATHNRAVALLLPEATDEQRKEFINDLVAVSREQIGAFETARPANNNKKHSPEIEAIIEAGHEILNGAIKHGRGEYRCTRWALNLMSKALIVAGQDARAL